MPLLVALLALVCGCGSEGADPPAAIIGAGELEFAPLADGETAFVIQGPQGGFHLIGSVRVTGMNGGNPDDLSDPDNPTTTFTVDGSSGRLDAGGASYTQGLDPAPPGGFEMIGRLVILDIASDDQLDGQMIVLTVSVRDADGLIATDSVSLLARPDPGNPIRSAR